MELEFGVNIFLGKYFNGNCMNDIYTQIYNEFDNNNSMIVSSRIGDTHEELHVLFSLGQPRNRWITIRVPSISPAYAIAELIYLISGSDEATVINPWNPKLQRYQGNYKYYPGAYGKRLRYSFGFDQLNRAYDALLNEPTSRQVLLDIWNPEVDLPKNQGKANNKDIPCNIISMLKIRQDKLYWSQIMRSNDMYLGLPYDVLLFTSLQEILAGWLQIDVGEYTHFCDSLHYYTNNKMHIDESANILVNTDDLRLEKNFSDEVFREMFARLNELSRTNQIDECVRNILSSLTVPKSYENMLMILCMYMLNKKSKKTDLIIECTNRCTNKLYTELFIKWETEHKSENYNRRKN